MNSRSGWETRRSVGLNRFRAVVSLINALIIHLAFDLNPVSFVDTLIASNGWTVRG